MYSQTRMDSAWEFRHAYDEARKIKKAQDLFCAKAEDGRWDELNLEHFPDDLQWESLVDVLRGKVKVSCSTYSFFVTLMLNYNVDCFHTRRLMSTAMR